MAKRGRPAVPIIIDEFEGKLVVVDGPSRLIGREVTRRNGQQAEYGGFDEEDGYGG